MKRRPGAESQPDERGSTAPALRMERRAAEAEAA